MTPSFRRTRLSCLGLLASAVVFAWGCATGAAGDDDDGDANGGRGGDAGAGAGTGAGAQGGSSSTTTTTGTGTGGTSGDCGVVVNELQVASSASASDEFVEIYNSCSTSVDLTDWQLVYRSSDGTNDNLLYSWSGGSVAGNGYLLIVGSAWSGGGAPDGSFTSGGLSGSGGGVGLRNSSGGLVDSVGYGNATNELIEQAAAEAPPEGSSAARSPNGADSDNNAADFAIRSAPTPKAPNGT